MSFLDLAPGDQAAQENHILQSSATHLPATFGDAFEATWNEGRYFSQSSAQATAQHRALTDYVDDVRERTGTDLTDAASHIVVNGDFTRANQEIDKLNAARPDLRLAPLSPDELNRRAIEISRQARTDYADMSSREGGGLGRFFGGLATSLTDPLNLAAAPIGGGEASILMTALKFGGVAAGSQVVNEAIEAPFREQVQPGYQQSGEQEANVAEAFGGGAALGAGGKVIGMALGRLWTRAKSGTWPTSVRDAGNVLESEANIQDSNVMPGAGGEVAHRDAMVKAIDDVTAARPVDVAAALPPEPAFSPDEIDAAREHATEEFWLNFRVRNNLSPVQFDQERGMHAKWMRDFFEENPAAPTIEQRAQQILRSRAAERDPVSAMDARTAPLMDALNEAHTTGATAAAERAAATERAELPFEATAKQAEHETAVARVADRVQQAANGDTGIRLDRVESRNPGDHSFDIMDGGRSVAALDVRPAGDKLEVGWIGAGEEGGLPDLGTTKVRAVLDRLAELYPEARTVTGTRISGARGLMADVDVAMPLRRRGVPRPDAEKIAQVMLASTEDGAKDIAAELPFRAQTLADTLPSPAETRQRTNMLEKMMAEREVETSRRGGALRTLQALGEEQPATPRAPNEGAQMLASADHEAAIRADIDRARAMGDVKIPAGIDTEGNPIFRSLDSAMDEVDGYKEAADQIQACANPVQEMEPA